MGEVVTLQCGEAANAVGSHAWNLLLSSFSSPSSSSSSSSSSVGEEREDVSRLFMLTGSGASE